MWEKVCNGLIGLVIRLSAQKGFQTMIWCHHRVAFSFVILHGQQSISHLLWLLVGEGNRIGVRVSLTSR